MADETKTPGLLEKEEALELARQGKDAWNAWAKKSEGWAVDFSEHDFSEEKIKFDLFLFPGDTYFVGCKLKDITFSKAKFVGAADFSNAEFSGLYVDFTFVRFNGEYTSFVGAPFQAAHIGFWRAEFNSGEAYFQDCNFIGGDADFSDVIFARDTWFTNSSFAKDATFSGAEFHDEAGFRATEFIGPVDLDGAIFKKVPDFRYTLQVRHFTLHGVKVEFAVSPEPIGWLGLFEKSPTEHYSDRFRRLKDMAKKAEDHEREQDFFAKELKAKRFYETNGPALFWSYLYEWLSDFGRSIYLPARAFLVTWFVFGLGYWLFAENVGRSLSNGLKLSASVLVPFVAAARTSYKESKEALYGHETGLLLDLFVVFEGILGLAFVFLIGLALRNRFRI